MPKETPVKEKKTPKPRPTAAERRAAQAARAQEAEAQRQKAWAEFNALRPQKWLELWAKALRLKVLIKEYRDVQSCHDWWFCDFHVDAKAQTFSTETLGGHSVSEEKLHPNDVERLHAGLDMAFEWIAEYEAEQERKRQEALIAAQKREAALAKLNEEDKKALGLR